MEPKSSPWRPNGKFREKVEALEDQNLAFEGPSRTMLRSVFRRRCQIFVRPKEVRPIPRSCLCLALRRPNLPEMFFAGGKFAEEIKGRNIVRLHFS